MAVKARFFRKRDTAFCFARVFVRCKHRTYIDVAFASSLPCNAFKPYPATPLSIGLTLTHMSECRSTQSGRIRRRLRASPPDALLFMSCESLRQKVAHYRNLFWIYSVIFQFSFCPSPTGCNDVAHIFYGAPIKNLVRHFEILTSYADVCFVLDHI